MLERTAAAPLAGAPNPSVVDRLLARAEAAARTALYTSVAAGAWRLGLPFSDVEVEYGRHAARDAYDLHVRMLERPGMREVLRRAEREDLATLPFFLASAPFDIARALGKQRRGTASLAVKAPDDFPYPDYYLNDFHHQANGNLSMRAALTYEWQIRFLFMGANRLMRQCLIDEVPEGSGLDVLDVGCGTASWVTQARLQGRSHRVTGVDLSPHYLAVARLFRGRGADFVQMNAERMDPAWTDRFDLVTCIWLFHELPPDAMANAATEIARVLRPGGRLLFMDAAQPVDVPPEGRATVDAISEHFRDLMNEPWFRLYQGVDLGALFGERGVRVEKVERVYTSRLMVARKEA